MMDLFTSIFLGLIALIAVGGLVIVVIGSAVLIYRSLRGLP